jgi:phosphate transport system permease protein
MPAIVGSLALILVAVLFAGVLAVPMAGYNAFYAASKKWLLITRMGVQCLAGVPSIILGLFGYSLFVRDMDMGRSLLAGGMTLGIMIFPYMEMRLEELFIEQAKAWRKSSIALGVSDFYTIRRIILPYLRRDILRVFALGAVFAMGAAAPIMLTAAVLFAPPPENLLSPVMALPMHLYILANENISLANAYATALVLLLLSGVINLAILFADTKRRGKNAGM